MAQRTRLFISYAVEDSVVACWLARKLLCCGYSIWIDNKFLPGGRIWPRHIDQAIKQQSIRMLHLLSAYSLSKHNPQAEMTLGLEMMKQIPNYLIPLNLGIRHTDLPWNLNIVQYIDFTDWGKGFASLLETLEGDSIPKEFASSGLDIALDTLRVPDAILPVPEPIYSNAHKLVLEPNQLWAFNATISIQEPEFRQILDKWPSYFVNPKTFVSYFDPPAKLAEDFGIHKGTGHSINDEVIHGIKTINIRKNLLLRSVRAGAIRNGFSTDKDALLFPELEEHRTRYPYITWWGERTNLAPYGMKTVGGKKWFYTIGFKPRIVLVGGVFHCVLVLRLGLAKEDGTRVERGSVQMVRKAIMKSWWNDKISKVQCALATRLCCGGDTFGYSGGGDQQVLFSAMPVLGTSPTTINETVVEEIARRRNTKTDVDFKMDAKPRTVQS